MDISLIVKDFKDVEDSLAAFTSFETLSGDNQYFCERCNRKVDALKGVKIRSLPPVLILSLLRFEYDVAQDGRVKNSSTFPFPLVLDLAPYREVTGQVAAAAIAPSAPARPPSKSVDVSSGEDKVSLQLGPDGSTSDDTYDLFGVVIHRGSNAGFGHYHAYIRDVGQSAAPVPSDAPQRDESLARFGRWFDFDDSRVSEIPVTTIAKQYGGRSECACTPPLNRWALRSLHYWQTCWCTASEKRPKFSLPGWCRLPR